MTYPTLRIDQATSAAAAFPAVALAGSSPFGPLAGVAFAAFLMLVLEEDLRRFKIPNRITFPALAGVLLLGLGTAGPAGLLSALAGAAAGLGLLFVPFALGWMGAGDVKAVMVVGAVFGAEAMPALLAWMVVLAGGLSLLVLATEGLSAARARIPFGVAIAFGVGAFTTWGTLS